MAENDLENTEADGEQDEAAAPAKNKKKWIILALALALLVLVGVSVAATLWVLSGSDTDTESGPDAAITADEGSEAEEPAREAAIYFPLKPEFVTSFEVRGRQRFMQVEMSLMLRDNSAIGDIELHMPAIRNSLVILLRGQIYPELQTPEGKELLRQQALNTVREVLQAETGEPVIEQVLFTNLVLQ
ncbi:flagellar basal body-associated FliL family protein [Gilvimarinus polysaccharolyticus]|uniref:flagellar basal body-associated FliL family protein n=1 Tax=Gilvimarinus polysaccharolyticus TaxID=863921 RepID=UPI00067366EB|nr:flagellar basal body-associated FliL family protein [Gilvimarinus polysaccharolyticus]